MTRKGALGYARKRWGERAAIDSIPGRNWYSVGYLILGCYCSGGAGTSWEAAIANAEQRRLEMAQRSRS